MSSGAGLSFDDGVRAGEPPSDSARTVRAGIRTATNPAAAMSSRIRLQFVLVVALAAVVIDASPAVAQASGPAAATVGARPRIDGRRMLADIAVLANDSLEG